VELVGQCGIATAAAAVAADVTALAAAHAATTNTCHYTPWCLEEILYFGVAPPKSYESGFIHPACAVQQRLEAPMHVWLGAARCQQRWEPARPTAERQ